MQFKPALQALTLIAETRPYSLVSIVDVARCIPAVVAGADVIPRQMIGTAHPPRRGLVRSEQAQASKAVVESIALVRLHRL
jgi:hypothetical protein